MSVTFETAAQAGSNTRVDALKTKQREAVKKRLDVEAKLRAARSHQQFAMKDFYASEQAFSRAEAKLKVTQLKLAAAQTRLQGTEAALDEVNARLKQHTDALWQRLEVFYKEGTLGYVSVALGAADFEQFVDRTVLLRSVAEDDVKLKTEIAADQSSKATLVADHERTVSELESFKLAEAETTQEMKDKASYKQDILEQARHDRSIQEQVYDETKASEHEVEQALYQLQNPAPPHVSPGSEDESSSDDNGSWQGGGASSFNGHFIKPCAGRFSSPFGWRIHPILGTRRFHDGQDIAAGYGTTIHAAAAGTVIKAGWFGAYGNAVMINHGGGMVTLYGHASSLLVHVGQKVSQGQPVARVGSTGWSTGPHCHFSVYRNGVAINPRGFIG